MKTIIRLVLLLSALLLIWYLVADRVTPYTSNARVKVVVTPIVPQVSGVLVEVQAANGQIVEAGTPLARIDPRFYQNEVERARAELDAAIQSIGASSAEVTAAQADVSRAAADLENVRLQSGRVFELENKGTLPVAQGDEARAALAEAQLKSAQERLGPEGEDNPAIRQALAAVSQAELNLEWTELTAPSRGTVSDLGVALGAYAKAGTPILTFLDVEDVWIEAYLTENNLGRIRLGDPVDVTLDIQPGRVLKGTVESLSSAASAGNESQAGSLATTPRSTGWMREPQRFPVRIVLPGYETGDTDDDILFQVNGQADIIVYTGENGLMNALGWAFIRAMSWVSYAY